MQNLKRNFILIGLIVLLVLSLSILSAQAADNDILVYYTYTFYPADIFVTDLANIGYNVNIVARPAVIPPGGHLGITPADPVNLLNYGQVWIIGGAHGVDFLPVEISAIKAFRDAPNSGGLLLSGENGPAFGETINERINQITSEYNNGTDLFHGCIRVNGCCNNFPLFTWGGHPIIHPLYIGLISLSSSNSDAELNIQNINIEVTMRSMDISDSIVKDHGAVLDDGLGGRIIFDTSWWRFIRANIDCTICCQTCPSPIPDCSTEQESIYQQNIAYWLDEVSPPVPTCNLSASPNSINSGDSVTLIWISNNANAVDSSNFGAAGVSGSITVSPTSSTTYNLAVSGPTGTGSCSANVNVSSPIPPPPTFFEGLVPCGRHYDNPDTDNVNESDECTVCHFFYLIKNLIDFVAGIAVVVAILFIAFGGVMYIGSTGNEAMLSKAKGIITYAIIGFILIFTAYIIIGLILSTFGYTNPLGGEWDVIC